MRCECFHRVIDPWSNKTVAAWGWLSLDKGLADQYWVSIDNKPYEFFTNRDWAEEYYYTNTQRLRAKVRQRRPEGPQKRGPKPRVVKQARAAAAGK